MEQQQQQSEPQLCQKGCGFFANVGCAGLCSKCHRDTEAEKERAISAVASATSAAQAVPPSPEPLVKSSQEAPSSSTSAQAAAASAAPAPAEASTSAVGDAGECKPKTRCLECKKKVGLTGFTCKCGGLFCGQHRYAEAHACPFDYKGAHAAKLAVNNPVVQASKIQKI